MLPSKTNTHYDVFTEKVSFNETKTFHFQSYKSYNLSVAMEAQQLSMYHLPV